REPTAAVRKLGSGPRAGPVAGRCAGADCARATPRSMSTAPSFTPGAAELASRASLLADRLSEGLKPLAPVAYNYRWSWSRDGASLFRDIDPHRWALAGENPVRFL